MTKNADLSKSSKKPDHLYKPAALLPGQPGYRTRDGRSGLDPIDMRTEAAHTAGTLLKNIFNGRVRNPFALFFLAGVGLLLLTPFAVAISDWAHADQFSIYAWIILFVTAVVGLALLVNIIRNLIKIVFK